MTRDDTKEEEEEKEKKSVVDLSKPSIADESSVEAVWWRPWRQSAQDELLLNVATSSVIDRLNSSKNAEDPHWNQAIY